MTESGSTISEGSPATSTMTGVALSGSLSRSAGWWQAAVAVVALVAGAALYGGFADSPRHLIDYELGRRPAAGQVSVLHHSLGWDLVLIAGYGIALILGTRLASRMAWTRTSKLIADFARLCAGLAIVSDLVEDLGLALGDRHDWCYDMATGASVVKWSALVPAGVVAFFGLVLTVSRLIANRPDRLRARAERLQEDTMRAPVAAPDKDSITPPLLDDEAPQPTPAGLAENSRWRRGYAIPGLTDEVLAQDRTRTAVCLSGGGVRSATVALGALQELRTTALEADYVISVSGGGYTSGALLQSLTAAGATPRSPADYEALLADTLAPGSAGEDHVRRHSSYLASGPGQMTVALLVLLRGLLGTLFVLFDSAIAIGLLLGFYFHLAPITSLAGVIVPTGSSSRVDYPAFSTPALLAIATLGVVALLAWMVAVGLANFWDWYSPQCQRPIRVAAAAAALAAIVLIFVVVIPSLAWLTTWIYVQLGAGKGINIGGPVVTVGLSYVAALAAFLWKHRASIKIDSGDGDSGKGGSKSITALVPKSLLQLLYVMAVVSLLSLVWLFVLGVAVTVGGSVATDFPHLDWTTWVALGVIFGGWLFVGGVVDETALSLHPFYRARLASAFAFRLGGDKATPYPPAERTRLDTYGRIAPLADHTRPPQFVFACAANLADDSRTAPGLRAVSYVLTADHIGGPDVGWIKTKTAIDACPPHLRKDLTVQSAVAISGAAIASAMGRASAWYETLLAVTGARLGSWLPHPDYVLLQRDAAAKDDWTLPALPHVRRLPYLVREVFGIHPYFQRLLHVTDGGHYENLGLVEALRRRCTKIYVIDSSGDSPPFATTFAEAIRLAHDELGVTITPSDPWQLVPGTGTLEPKAPLGSLNGRLAKSGVVHATIEYPPVSGLPATRRTGELVFAKATLWQALPYEMLTYAAKNDVFPHDSTADQWFVEGQFSQYKALGVALGAAASAPAPAAHHRPPHRPKDRDDD
jgi:hypothetical protein